MPQFFKRDGKFLNFEQLKDYNKKLEVKLELIAKEGTPDGGLEIKKAGKIFKAFHNLARKNNKEEVKEEEVKED